MQESIVFLLRVQCRKESSLSLSHLLMTFLLHTDRHAGRQLLNGYNISSTAQPTELKTKDANLTRQA